PYFITTRDDTRFKENCMARIQIDVQELFAKANGVQATADRMQSEVSSMEAQLRQLQESWVGQAASNFQSVATEGRSTQQRVEEALRSIRDARQHAGQQYESTDQADSATFRGSRPPRLSPCSSRSHRVTGLVGRL